MFCGALRHPLDEVLPDGRLADTEDPDPWKLSSRARLHKKIQLDHRTEDSAFSLRLLVLKTSTSCSRQHNCKFRQRRDAFAFTNGDKTDLNFVTASAEIYLSTISCHNQEAWPVIQDESEHEVSAHIDQELKG